MNKLMIFAVSVSGLALAPRAFAADGQSAAVPLGAAVASYYDTYGSQSIWFRGGANTAVVGQLTAILQRAPFDGLRVSGIRIFRVEDEFRSS